jgi:transposase
MAKDDPRAAFVAANAMRQTIKELPTKAVEDLKYFAAEAGNGRPIRRDAVLDWLQKHYGVKVGITQLRRLMEEAGVSPWFSA